MCQMNPCTHEIISVKGLQKRNISCSNTGPRCKQFQFSTCSLGFPPAALISSHSLKTCRESAFYVWLSINLFSHCDGLATALNNTEQELASKGNQWWMVITSSDMLIHMRPTSCCALSCMQFYFHLILRLSIFACWCNFKNFMIHYKSVSCVSGVYEQTSQINVH